jgi:hypothetical protein
MTVGTITQYPVAQCLLFWSTSNGNNFLYHILQPLQWQWTASTVLETEDQMGENYSNYPNWEDLI